MERIQLTICDNCPCRNSDIEDGSSCNLGYDCGSDRFDKVTKTRIPEGVTIHGGRGNTEFMYYSRNCRLHRVEYGETVAGSTTTKIFEPDRTYWAME